MSYTGNVTVGGPPDSRELPGLSVTKLAVGPMDNNAYLLRDLRTGEALLIDAAAEPDRLIELIGDTPVVRIVTTHKHADHWQALAEVQAATGAAVAAHPIDAEEIPVTVTEPVEDGDTVRAGDVELTVLHLRGPTPGSIALRDDAAAEPHLVTGDSLFPGGPGRTTSPADFTSLLNDLEQRVFDQLPDPTWVYPGHGNDTTLGAERPHVPEWRARGW